MTKKMRSKFEEKVAKELDSLGIEYGYEVDKIYYSVIHEYTPDFTLPNGILVETKGYFTAADRAKHLYIKKQFPLTDLRFVFMNANNKLNKNSSTTYADWCNKNGFIWAEKTIPQSWVGEK